MTKNEIDSLISDFKENDLTRVKITKKDFSIELEKGGSVMAPQVVQPAPAVVATPAPQTQTSTPATASGDSIKSPMVGTFYAAPAPDAQEFVKVGDTVRRGQKVAIVEAMKIMNEIEAEFDCKILEVLVKDGDVVDFDKPLFSVEKL